MLNMDPPQHTRYRLLVNKGFTPADDRAARTSASARSRDDIVDLASPSAASATSSTDVAGRAAAPGDRRAAWASRRRTATWSSTGRNRHDRLRRPRVRSRGRGRPQTAVDGDVRATRNQLAEPEARQPARRHRQRRCCTPRSTASGSPSSSSTCSSCCSRSPATRRPATSSPTACSRSSSTPTSGERLLGRPAAPRPAVEEMLRWASPVMHFRRTAHAATPRSAARRSREGDKVVIWYISANRDEDVFERPVPLRHRPRRPTSTSPSAAAARTSASAPTWPGSRSG